MIKLKMLRTYENSLVKYKSITFNKFDINLNLRSNHHYIGRFNNLNYLKSS